MKKLLLLALILTLCVSAVACASDKNEPASEEPGSVVSESESSAPSAETSEEPIVIYKKDINTMKVFNVTEYGAKHNGYDDSASIQAAIDACAASGGGKVYFPTGEYTIGKTLYKKANVSMVGDDMWGTKLIWKGAKGGTIINTANEALWGTSIENLFFTSSVENVTGILGGSTLQKYNSAIGTFKNLVFSNLHYGINGSAEPQGVGIFDCLFENVFASACTYGFRLYGSGNTIIHPRVSTCEAGLVLDYLNGESFDGVHVIGGIFAANKTDILIPSKNGTRPCNFVGTWFENAEKGILNITNPGTRVMNLTFRDCMLNSQADNKNYFLFDASNATGVVTLDSCTVVNDDGIKAPTDKASVFAVTNLQVYDSKGTYVINDKDSGSFIDKSKSGKRVFTVPHALKAVPSLITVTPSTEGAAKIGYYVTADESNITVTFVADTDGDIGFYWEVSK